jgi:hypothetical protein
MTNLKFDHARTLSSRFVVVSKIQTTISLTWKSEQWTEKECVDVEFDHQRSRWEFRFDELLCMATIDGAAHAHEHEHEHALAMGLALALVLVLAFDIVRLSLH